VWLSAINGAIAHSSGEATQWVKFSSGDAASVSLRDIDFPDATHGWAVGDEGTIIHTSDGGRTWATQECGVDSALEGVTFVDSRSGFVVGDFGTILATTDGGASWARQTSPAGLSWAAAIYAVASLDGQRAWAVDDSGGLEFTTDGGAVWQRMRLASRTSSLFDVAFADERRGWIAGDDGVLYTSDGGLTWSRQSPNRNLFAIAFADSAHGWGVGNVILRTFDGGSSWQNVTPRKYVDRRVTLFGVAAQDPQRVWAVGSRTLSLGRSRGVVLCSSDGGRQWVDATPRLGGRTPAWTSVAVAEEESQ
jgi:photosystem II stability/assembly factor-like uncharacterized protein